MPLSPDMIELKARCAKALQMGAGLARVEAHLAAIGAGPAPAGLPKEQHLMDVLSAMENGSYQKAAPATPAKAKEPAPEPVKAEEPAPEPEAVKAEEAAPEVAEAAPEEAAEEAPKAKRKR